MEFLVFQLHAPLAAWGASGAASERRPIWTDPSKSAVLGIVGAALGIERKDHAALDSLHRGYAYALRTECSAELLTDYHTVQSVRGNMKLRSRAQALAVAQDKIETMLTRREYAMDGSWRAALHPLENAPYDLEELCDALKTPRFMLFAGRKACPFSAPLSPRVIDAKDVAAAFEAYTPLVPLPASRRKAIGAATIWADTLLAPEAQYVRQRRDMMTGAGQRQFSMRQEARLDPGAGCEESKS